jgi:hypothetical protein
MYQIGTLEQEGGGDPPCLHPFTTFDRPLSFA